MKKLFIIRISNIYKEYRKEYLGSEVSDLTINMFISHIEKYRRFLMGNGF